MTFRTLYAVILLAIICFVCFSWLCQIDLDLFHFSIVASVFKYNFEIFLFNVVVVMVSVMS